jgi:hypothetical protein
MAGGDAEQGPEPGLPPTATVEAEDEFIEVGLETVGAQAVIDAQRPGFEVGKGAVSPGQHDVRGHGGNGVGIVDEAGGAGIAGPAVGLGGGAGSKVGGQEGAQAVGRASGNFRETDAGEACPAICHLDRPGIRILPWWLRPPPPAGGSSLGR